MSGSSKSIWIETPSIIDSDLVQTLADIAKKGRDVRLILDRSAAGENPDILRDLKANGVQIKYYPSKPSLGMHLALFDNSSFIVSSSSWTHTSFITNHEFSITVPSPTASAKLSEMFKADWDKSTK